MTEQKKSKRLPSLQEPIDDADVRAPCGKKRRRTGRYYTVPCPTSPGQGKGKPERKFTDEERAEKHISTLLQAHANGRNKRSREAKNDCVRLGVPYTLLRPLGDRPRPGGWLAATKFIERLALIEAELTQWEEAHPELYAQLPWYEAREQYKKDKAAGLVPELEWWEVAGYLERWGGRS